jgi:hypothetical protein
VSFGNHSHLLVLTWRHILAPLGGYFAVNMLHPVVSFSSVQVTRPFCLKVLAPSSIDHHYYEMALSVLVLDSNYGPTRTFMPCFGSLPVLEEETQPHPRLMPITNAFNLTQ